MLENCSAFPYIYNFYGYNLYSNVYLPLLHQYDKLSPTVGNIKFNVMISDNVPAKPLMVKEEEGIYRATFKDLASYEINCNHNEINVVAKNLDCVTSTMFNFPMSIFIAVQGGVLIHGSSLCYEDSLMCFCASKGTGKSTWVTQCLNYFLFYSDDTLAVRYEKEDMRCDRASTFVKLTETSSAFFNITGESFDNLKKNISGKGYLDVSSKAYIGNECSPKLSAIFLLSRYEKEGIAIKEVYATLTKETILLTNIVGSRRYPLSLLNIVRNSKTFRNIVSNIKFYRLYIPNDFDKLNESASQFSQLCSLVLDNSLLA